MVEVHNQKLEGQMAKYDAVPARWSTTIVATMDADAYQDSRGYWWINTPVSKRPIGGFYSKVGLIEAAYRVYMHEIRAAQVPYGGGE